MNRYNLPSLRLSLCSLFRFILIGVAMTALFAVPEDNNPAWLTSLLISKLIAAAAIIALGILRGYETAAAKPKHRSSREAAGSKSGAKSLV